VVEPEVQPAGFGGRLAAEREKRGLSIDDVAARLRLHPKQVRAIETEELPALPAPFLRGFVRNYAKELGLDPAPLLAELNARLGPQPGATPPTPVGAGAPAARSLSDRLSRPVVLAGVLGALVIFAVLGWFSTVGERRHAEPTVVAPKTPPAAPQPAATLAAEAPKPEAAAPPAPEPAKQVAVAPAPAATAAAASAPSAAVAATDSVHLVFRDRSWVEVTQADGRIVHSQINEAGTEQRIDGKPPLRLVIGNASEVSLDYKGKPIDLKSSTSVDNVARITLN
jgi:cytoskeleton protein RodZ